MPYIEGKGLAPEQYRIGVKLAAWWLVRHLHWGFRHGFGLMDTVCSVVGLLLMLNVLESKRWFRQANTQLKWFACAGFVLLTSFYLAWIETFFRPETLPTVGLIATMVWLWSGRGAATPSAARQLWTALGLLVISALQATIRADAVCLLSVGMLIVSVLDRSPGLALRRVPAILTSSACGLVGAGIQLYIMRVMYPHASYGSIPVVMARYDLRQPLIYPPFLLFILPVAWTAGRFWRQRPPKDGANIGVLIASVLYFALWVVMGKLDEVRIFVPFAVALIPLSIELMLRKIRDRGADALDPTGAEA